MQTNFSMANEFLNGKRVANEFKGRQVQWHPYPDYLNAKLQDVASGEGFIELGQP
jgi:hypothetical protein